MTYSNPNPGFYSNYALADETVSGIFPPSTVVPFTSITAVQQTFINSFSYVPVILWWRSSMNQNINLYINGNLYDVITSLAGITTTLDLKASNVVCPQQTTIGLSAVSTLPTSGSFIIGSVCSS